MNISIDSLNIENFKSIQKSGELDLKPLTLCVGPNSSGKTSLLQTLLLCKQTLVSRNVETPLIINGKYFDFKSFINILHKHKKTNELNLKFKLNFDISEYIRNRDTPKKYLDELKKQEAEIALKFYWDEKINLIKSDVFSLKYTNGDEITITETEIRVKYEDKVIVYKIDDRIYFENRNFLKIPRDIERIRYYIFEINDYIRRRDKLRRERTSLNKEIEEILLRISSSKNSEEINVLNKTHKALLARLDILEKDINRLSSRIAQLGQRANVRDINILSIHLRILSAFLDKLQTLFIENLYYIGPLREYPQRYYFTTGEKPTDVGSVGENTVDVMFHGIVNDPTKYEKVRKWMKHMGLAFDINISRIDEAIYVLNITDPELGIEVNISDVGFGASQILPIMVEGYYANPGTILLIEQPEIHLHPRLQSDLCDLFIDFIKDGKQLVVETHSEHIILRIQRRIAEGKLSPEDVNILFFEPSSDGSVITHIEFDQSGLLSDWPKGFFDSDLEDAFEFIMNTEE